VNQVVFPELVKRLREAVFAERKKPVALLVRDLTRILRERKEAKVEKSDKDLNEARRRETEAMLDRLKALGYDEDSALDAATAVLRHRFAELV
jgi:serine protein kinase